MAIEHSIMTEDGIKTVKLTPMKAIREKCLECSCGSKFEIRKCPIKDCALYPYRFGKNPARKGVCGNISPTQLPIKKLSLVEV